MNKIREKAYEEGKKHFQLKALYAKNPYMSGTVEHYDWNRGCEEAYAEFLKSYLEEKK